MLSLKLFRDQMPMRSATVEQLDVLHMCHSLVCIEAKHLNLDSDSNNMDHMVFALLSIALGVFQASCYSSFKNNRTTRPCRT